MFRTRRHWTHRLTHRFDRHGMRRLRKPPRPTAADGAAAVTGAVAATAIIRHRRTR